MAQSVLFLVQHVLVTGAKSFFIHLDPGIRLHHRSAQVAVYQGMLRMAAQCTQGTGAPKAQGVPYWDGIQMIAHAFLLICWGRRRCRRESGC